MAIIYRDSERDLWDLIPELGGVSLPIVQGSQELLDVLEDLMRQTLRYHADILESLFNICIVNLLDAEYRRIHDQYVIRDTDDIRDYMSTYLKLLFSYRKIPRFITVEYKFTVVCRYHYLCKRYYTDLGIDYMRRFLV